MIQLVYLVLLVLGWCFALLCAIVQPLGIWVWTRIIFVQAYLEDRLETLRLSNPFLFKW